MEEGGLALLVLTLLTYGLNVPLGYWRASAKDKGRRGEMLLAIHAAVPYVAWARREAGLGLVGVAVFVVLYFLGQATGSLLYEARRRRGLSSSRV